MNDEDWMQYVLSLAKKAEQQDEVPIGAILVMDGECIAEGWNKPISSNDPTAHAEMLYVKRKLVNNFIRQLINSQMDQEFDRVTIDIIGSL